MKASEPKEYWVNVYLNRQAYFSLHSKSIEEAENNYKNYGGGAKIIYRIHVKMDGGYNKRFGKDLFYQRIWKDGQSV